MYEIETTDFFDKWRDKLKDIVAKDRIRARLVLMSRGVLGDTSHVGKGVFEARIHYGAGYRLYFVNKGNRIILLLCGGDKSTQKSDIKKAHDLAEEV